MHYDDRNQPKFDPKSVLKGLSKQDFALFGVQDVGYIRPTYIDGRKVYSVHAADGSHLSVSDDEKSAALMLRQSGLEAVRLQ